MKTLFLAILITPLFSSGVSAEPLKVFRDCDVCSEMVELPLGEFMMGAPDDEFRAIAYFRRGGKKWPRGRW